MSPLAGKGTWCLLPATPAILATATKHFDWGGGVVSETNFFTPLHRCY